MRMKSRAVITCLNLQESTKMYLMESCIAGAIHAIAASAELKVLQMINFLIAPIVTRFETSSHTAPTCMCLVQLH